ncbi:187-kDa microtubule-associated protein air9 [Ancistrocladus abbreviatus]
MEDSVLQSVDDAVTDSEILKHAEQVPVDEADRAKKVTETVRRSISVKSKAAGAAGSIKKSLEPKSGSRLKSEVVKSSLTGSLKSSSSVQTSRRNSTGGLAEKQSVRTANVASVGGKKTSPAASDHVRRSLPEIKRSLSLSAAAKEPKKPGPASTGSTPLRTPTSSGVSEKDSTRKPSFTQSTVSSSRKADSSSLESTASSVVKKTPSNLSSSLARTPSVTSGSKSGTKLSPSSVRSPSTSTRLKKGSLSSSLDRSSKSSGRRKPVTPDSRDSRFIILPQRLDLRGHRIHSLNSIGMNLSSNLEFVYLRDNLLASLEGIEILKRVKVLDLSFNDFKGPGFEPLGNCKVLQQLYLAGNQITSLSSLPELPNLEFLSVAQNKLKSLSMASQPRLQVLAASKNKISTLKGFPLLPVLEHLRVEENPILRMPHLEAASILLVGPTLKKFNDRDLSKEEIAIAKQYPAHTALCIRDGWEFCSPEHAADSTFHFLVEHWKDQLPPGFQLKEASIDPPFVEDACRCHFIFVQDHGVDSKLVLKYQWYLGERALSTFMPIPNAMGEVYCPKREDVDKFLKVDCIPILEDTEYLPIFAISSPVSPGTGCPKVLNLDVRGDLVEGNVIKGHAVVAWCGGTPGKGVASWLRRRWNSSPVVIVGAEEEEYQLTIDDVDSSLVFMYTPVTEEGTKGEPQYAITDFIKAAPPSVSNVRIVGDLVEGCTIKGAGDYFGGREGPSKFEWLRENNDRRDFDLVLAGVAEYTLTREDVGRCMAFVYIPINFEGKEGESVSVISEVVKRAPPKVMNLKIIGDLREGSKITVTGTVTGGTEGSSRVQWFKSGSPAFEAEDILEALSTSKIAKAFRMPLGAVGHYIVAKFIPMTPDGEAGQPAYAISDKTVETLPPSLNFLSVTGDYVEGELLTASYGYVGGHEGRSMFNWYLHEAENDAGTPIYGVAGLLQYRISTEAIGKLVSFECTPVRDDGIVGEPRTCMAQERVRAGSPRLLSLQIIGNTVEGSTLYVQKKYWGGEEGDSVFRWFRTSSDGHQSEISGATTASYILSVDDIGLFISVSCEPVRSDWARGPVVITEQLGPIIPGPPTCRSLEFSGLMIEGQRLSITASYSGGKRGDCSYEWFRVRNNGLKEKLCDVEFLDLTLEDVGSHIEVVFTPVRDDGVRGISMSIMCDVIMPAEPMGLALTIPDCCESIEVLPYRRYFGGQEGDGEYVWYRTKDKLSGYALTEISGTSEGVVICGNALTYTPTVDDVGSYLALYWVPIRKDGKHGKPLISICSNPVAPAHPIVTNVRVKELSLGVYSGEGQYFGGYEGSSLFGWYRETAEGTIILINGANTRTYEVTESDYTCRLLFGYTPVRSDSVIGELRLSEPTGIILPELPEIEVVALTGKAIEGDVLTAVEVIPKSKSQQHVWEKYKRDVRYQWYYSLDSVDKTFEPLPSQRSCSYKVRFEDIGRCLKCECVVSDVFGRSSMPAYAETSTVLPGIPRIDRLEIEGRGFHTNLYAVKGTYSGGKEGKSQIQWLRSMVGSPDLISIPGETGRMYEANVDDVGYRLVVVYTPVREDGIEGKPVSASTEPIAVEPDVLAEVKKKLDLGSVKFEVLCDRDRLPKKVFGAGSLERRLLEVNRKRVKVVKPGSKTSFPTTEIRGTYAPPFHVELSRNDQHRLRIVVDNDNEVDLVVHTRHLRDVIVLVLRGMAQRFNSTSLNTLLKIET